MQFAAAILAAGSGSRAGPGAAKQWRTVGGKPVLRWSVEALAAAGARPVVVVTAETELDHAAELLADITHLKLVIGGATRFDSSLAALRALEGDAPEAVL